MYWIPMDICFGYILISFGYGLDLFRIYSQAAAWPGASPTAGECPAVLASQSVMVQVHEAIVTRLDTMPQCQADSSMIPVPCRQTLGI